MEVSLPTMQLIDAARLVDGQWFGNPETPISNALPLRDAVAGCITLADSDKQIAIVNKSPAAAVVVAKHYDNCKLPMLVVSDIHGAFQQLIHVLRPQRQTSPSGVHVNASVATTAKIGKGSTVAMGATIGDECEVGEGCVIHAGVHIMDGSRLGDRCEIFPNTVLYPNTILGNNVIVHANATLGAFGFGYRMSEGRHVRTAQLGWVELGDDVEIGAGTTIDRGTYGPTRIGTGTKIDNQVQIGHNCHIGEHNLLCAKVGIAGSCTTGKYVVMAGQAGMADHIVLEDRVVVGAQAGVMTNVDAGTTVLGSPAINRRAKMQEIAITSKLPELRKELKQMRKELDSLRHLASNSNPANLSSEAA